MIDYACADATCALELFRLFRPDRARNTGMAVAVDAAAAIAVDDVASVQIGDRVTIAPAVANGVASGVVAAIDGTMATVTLDNNTTGSFELTALTLAVVDLQTATDALDGSLHVDGSSIESLLTVLIDSIKKFASDRSSRRDSTLEIPHVLEPMERGRIHDVVRALPGINDATVERSAGSSTYKVVVISRVDVSLGEQEDDDDAVRTNAEVGCKR